MAKDALALTADCGSPPSVLVACDDSATIQLMFNGNFPLCRFSLATLIENDEQGVCNGLVADSVKVKKVQLSRDWSEMGVLASV